MISHLWILEEVHRPEVDVAVDELPAGHQLAFHTRTIFGHLKEPGCKCFIELYLYLIIPEYCRRK